MIVALDACNDDSNGCPEGYEGDQCDEEVREKFVGTYLATWYQIGIDTFDSDFVIEKDFKSLCRKVCYHSKVMFRMWWESWSMAHMVFMLIHNFQYLFISQRELHL